MSANGSSSWPTAVVTDANGARSFGLDGARIRANAGPTLNDMAASWTTPSATDSNRGGTLTEAMTGTTLVQQVNTIWPTPMAGTPAQNGNSAAGNSDFTRRADLLAERVLASAWPTPAARDHKGENSPDHLTNGTGRLHMDQLPNAVAHAFTRPDPATGMAGGPPSPHAPISRPLWGWMTASHGRRTSLRLWKGRTKQRLNPLFVEWLMGWPPGHALCACSATEFTLWKQHMRGAVSRLPTASGPWIWMPPAETEAAPEQMSLWG